MWDWVNSPEFFLVAVILAAAVFFRKRRLKKTNVASWEALRAACTTSTRKIAKAPEAAWITALHASVAKDAWKPGLKPSTKEQVPQLQSHPSYERITGQLEMAARQAADPRDVAQAQPYFSFHSTPEPAERAAAQVPDREILWARCEAGDPGFIKLRRWLIKGKTVFAVIVFPPADHEGEKTHEGQAVLEEVTEQGAKFRMNGANARMFFPDFTLGYDRKRKRPVIRFRERL